MQKLTIIALVALSFLFAQETKKADAYLSLVERDEVSSYYNCLATIKKQEVVVTAEKIPSAIKSHPIYFSVEKDLYLLEAKDSKLEKLEQEIVRFDNILLIALPKRPQIYKKLFLHKHFPLKPDLYMEPLAEKVTQREQLQESSAQTGEFLVAADKFAIDSDFMKTKMEEFTGVSDVVVQGEKRTLGERNSDYGRQMAREYLKQEYEKLGFTVSYHEYKDMWGRVGYNFIAEKPGTEAGYYIISSHYDTVRGTVGADDDATGTIMSLTIAKSVSDANLAYGLRVLAFDHEEIGLVGSKAYAKSINDSGDLDNMIGLIQMEMSGYDADGDGAFHVIDCNKNTSSDITAEVMAAVAQYQIDLKNVDACTNRSDHASFWAYNKPAIVISQNFFGNDSNPCYHQYCDTMDRVDLDYMGKITQAITYTMAKLLQAKK